MANEYEVLSFTLHGPDPIGLVHLPVGTGLNILYGRNGAGKSRILSSLVSTLKGEMLSVWGSSAESWLHLRTRDLPSHLPHDGLMREVLLAASRNIWGERAKGRSLSEILVERAQQAGMDAIPYLEELITEIQNEHCLSLLTAGTREQPEWLVFASARINNDTPALHRFVFGIKGGKPGFVGTDWYSSVFEETIWPFIGGPGRHPLPPPWVPTPMIYLGPIRDGVPLVFTEAATDLDNWTVKFMADHGVDVLESAGNGTFSISTTAAVLLVAMKDLSNQLLQRLLPGAPILDATITDPNSWVRGIPAVSWTADGAELPLSIDDLSQAERRWARLAVQLAVPLTLDSATPRVVIIDEPEQALHTTAKRTLASILNEFAVEQKTAVVVASHATEFLLQRPAWLHHVERPHAGLASTAPLNPHDFDSLVASAESLGLEPMDLLQRIRAFLLVEGEHEIALIEEFIGHELDHADVEVIALRGLSNLTAVIDSRFLAYSSARIIIVSDNTKNANLEHVWNEALCDWHKGNEDRARARIEQRIRKIRRRTEEQKLLSFMLLALDSPVADRISFFGFSEKDIIRYLPADAFVASSTWEQLRKEHRTSGKDSKNPKDWLRSNGIEVTADRVREVASNLDLVPQEFQALLNVCLRAAGFPPDSNGAMHQPN